MQESSYREQLLAFSECSEDMGQSDTSCAVLYREQSLGRRGVERGGGGGREKRRVDSVERMYERERRNEGGERGREEVEGCVTKEQGEHVHTWYTYMKVIDHAACMMATHKRAIGLQAKYSTHRTHITHGVRQRVHVCANEIVKWCPV